MTPERRWVDPAKRHAMEKIDAYFLYTIGSELYPIEDFRWQQHGSRAPTTFGEARYPIFTAQAALKRLLGSSVFRLKTSIGPGRALLFSDRRYGEKDRERKRPL